MNKLVTDQKVPNAKRSDLKAKKEKTARAKFADPSFNESNGDLGIKRIQNNNDIPRQVKAPTRTSDNIRNHVGAVGNAMSKAGFKL